MHWRERDAVLGLHYGDVEFVGLALNLQERVLLPLLDVVTDDLALTAVFVALEYRRDGGFQIFDQFVDGGSQPGAVTGRKFQHQGFMAAFEIVDVAPVRRRGFVFGLLF